MNLKMSQTDEAVHAHEHAGSRLVLDDVSSFGTLYVLALTQMS